MKAKYVVYREYCFDETIGGTLYKRVKTFKNEPEAMAFIDDPKNLYMYGELFLERHYPDGNICDWDACKQEWVSRDD